MEPMKTKYIIVNTQDRLPTESDQYYTDQGKIDFSNKNGNFWDENDEFELYPNWWLEEVPDHSEEMLSVLSEVMRFKHELRMIMSDKLQYPDNFLKALNDAEQLINKVKDNGK